jgi:hypothetical protein
MYFSTVPVYVFVHVKIGKTMFLQTWRTKGKDPDPQGPDFKQKIRIHFKIFRILNTIFPTAHGKGEAYIPIYRLLFGGF